MPELLVDYDKADEPKLAGKVMIRFELPEAAAIAATSNARIAAER